MQPKLPPIHPGEILKEEFMVPYELSAIDLAARIFVPVGRVRAISSGKRAIKADTALRLSKLFGTTAEFWLNLQQKYDLDIAREAIGDELRKITPLRRAVSL